MDDNIPTTALHALSRQIPAHDTASVKIYEKAYKWTLAFDAKFTPKWVRNITLLQIDRAVFSKGITKSSYKMRDVTQPEVVFVTKFGIHNYLSRNTFFNVAITQSICNMMVEKFNAAYDFPIKFKAQNVFVLELVERMQPHNVCSGELFVESEYKERSITTDTTDPEFKFFQTFNHYVISKTNHEFCLSHFQLVNTFITSLVIHTRSGKGFTEQNQGQPEFLRFADTHKCNEFCEKLQLPPIDVGKLKEAPSLPRMPNGTPIRKTVAAAATEKVSASSSGQGPSFVSQKRAVFSQASDTFVPSPVSPSPPPQSGPSRESPPPGPAPLAEHEQAVPAPTVTTASAPVLSPSPSPAPSIAASTAASPLLSAPSSSPAVPLTPATTPITTPPTPRKIFGSAPKSPQVTLKPAPETKPTSDAKLEIKPEQKAEPQAKSDAKIESKPEVKVEPKVEPKVEAKVETKIDAKPEAKVEAKVEPKAEHKAEQKAEAKVDPKVEVKAEPKAEPKVDAKVEPKAESKVEAKPEPKLDPKVEQKPAPPKAEQKPPGKPKPEQKSEPKVEPKKPEPKVEPKSEPKPESKPEPKPEPKPESKPETKLDLKMTLDPAKHNAGPPVSPRERTTPTPATPAQAPAQTPPVQAPAPVQPPPAQVPSVQVPAQAATHDLPLPQRPPAQSTPTDLQKIFTPTVPLLDDDEHADDTITFEEIVYEFADEVEGEDYDAYSSDEEYYEEEVKPLPPIPDKSPFPPNLRKPGLAYAKKSNHVKWFDLLDFEKNLLTVQQVRKGGGEGMVHVPEPAKVQTPEQIKWDLKSFRINTEAKGAQAECVTGDENQFIYTGSSEGYVAVWEVQGLKVNTSFKTHSKAVKSLLLRDAVLYTGSSDTNIASWDINTKKSINKTSSKAEINALAMSVAHNLLFSAENDKTIKVWDLHSLQYITTLNGHSRAVKALYVLGNYLFSGSNDQQVFVWNLNTQRVVKGLLGHEGWIRSIHAQGSTLYTGSQDETIRLWDLNSTECFQVIQAKGPVQALVPTPQCLFSAAGDYIEVWNNDYQSANVLNNRAPVLCMWNKDQQLFCGSIASSLKVWSWD